VVLVLSRSFKQNLNATDYLHPICENTHQIISLTKQGFVVNEETRTLSYKGKKVI
jgi:hypothetical protein